MNVKEVPEN